MSGRPKLPAATPTVVKSLALAALGLPLSLAGNYRELLGWLDADPWRWSLVPIAAVSLGLIYVRFEKHPITRTGTGTPPNKSELEENRRHVKVTVRHYANELVNRPAANLALEMGLQDSPSVAGLENSMTLWYQELEKAPQEIPRGAKISEIFRNHQESLVILGAPGSGKTTLLANLALELLDRSGPDGSDLLPVFLNLSSWTPRDISFEEWLSDQLSTAPYNVPLRVSGAWLESGPLALLLDGLDEVKPETSRVACIRALNQFRKDHGVHRIAVCSRIEGYESVTHRIQVSGAVLIQPLTEETIRESLERAGPPAAALLSIWSRDPSIQKLLKTPLMLNFAIAACDSDEPLRTLETGTFEERRDNLIANFVDAMLRSGRGRKSGSRLAGRSETSREPGSFGNRAGDQIGRPMQTLYWLSWLAAALVRKGRTVFYLEDLNVDWLQTRGQQWLAKAGVIVVFGLFFAFVFGVASVVSGAFDTQIWIGGADLIGGMKFDLNFGLIGGLALGFFFAQAELRPVELPLLHDIRSRLRAAAKFGTKLGLIGGLTFGLGSILLQAAGGRLFGRLQDGLLGGLVAGLGFGLPIGLLSGLISLVTTEAVGRRRIPNQGTRDSIRNGLVVTLIAGLAWGVLAAQAGSDGDKLSNGLAAGIKIGLFGGLFGGVAFAIKHYVVRLALWMSGSAPIRYVPFLNDGAERLLFLRRVGGGYGKVGGGYEFVHGLLWEYIASLWECKDASSLVAEGGSSSSGQGLGSRIPYSRLAEWQAFARQEASALTSRRKRALVVAAVAVTSLAVSLGWSFREARQVMARGAVARGNSDLAKNDLVSANLEYSDALELIPDYAEAHYGLATVYELGSEFDRAIVEYRAAIKARPEYAEAHYGLGSLLFYSKEQYDAGIAELRVAIKWRPSYAEAHDELGEALYSKGQYDAAIAEFRNAIALKPDLQTAHNSLGFALDHKGQYDAAVAELRTAIAVKSDVAEVHNNLGFALEHKGQHNAAWTEYITAISLFGNTLAAKADDAEADYGVGLALDHMGQDSSAIEYYHSAVAHNKGSVDNMELYCDLGHALTRAGRYDDAITYIEKALQIAPENPNALERLAVALAGRGQFEAAVGKYQQALNGDANNAAIHLHLSQALAKLGRRAEAARESAKAHALNPKSKEHFE
jgi:tetratricopeptide (TPR) repeat protein